MPLTTNPFVSKAQEAACYAKKAAGEAGSWDCGEWSRATMGKKLPKRKGKPTRNASPQLVRVWANGHVTHVIAPAHLAGSVVRNADGDNCGTGAGGFQPGNTCGAKEGGVSSVSELTHLTERDRDLAEELLDNGAEIDKNGMVVVYHRTSPEFADRIRATGNMTGEEDGLFFSTAKTGQAEGFGNAVVSLKIPLAKLEIDDTFGNEAHVRMPLRRAGQIVSVRKFIVNAAVRIGPLADQLHDQMDEITKSDARETARIIKDATERGVTDYERVGREIAKRTNYGDEDKARAETVARTELTRAYAEGFLDDLDDDAVVVFVAGDEENTCQECLDLDGEEFTVDEARGMIPIHPNCSCAWELSENDEPRGWDDDLSDNANPDQPRDDHGRWTGEAGMSDSAKGYLKTARYNSNTGKKPIADLPSAKLQRLIRSYSAQVLAAERAGDHDTAHELVHAAPHLLPGVKLLSSVGAVEPYDGGRHEGKLAGHQGNVRVLRPGLTTTVPKNKRLLGGGGGDNVVIRARAEVI